MGSTKWIAGLLGWVVWGPIGGILAFLAASFIEGTIDVSRQIGAGSNDRQAGQQTGQSYGQGYGQRTTGQTGTGSSRRYSSTEQRNSFFVSLLILSSAVIKADGKVQQKELNYVRDFFRSNFGEDAANQAMQMLNQLNAQQVNIYSVGDQIASNMNYSQRLQLFQYLVQIALADGDFAASEKSVLEAIGSVIRLSSSDIASVIAMYYKEADAAYTILEISPSATDDEVRTAYRRMAMNYHPDRVATLGEDVQKAAEEKFKKVQEAYESIKKQRGMK